MKKIIILITICFKAGCISSQPASGDNNKEDSAKEATQKKIHTIITQNINKGLDKIYAGGKDKYQYFTIRFKIVDYNKIQDYYTSLGEKKISDTIINSLNESLKVLQAEELDYNVFDKIDLFIQVIVIYRENRDSGFDASIPIRNLSNHYYFIRDESLSPIKELEPIFKCYQLGPVLYIRPEEAPSWRTKW